MAGNGQFFLIPEQPHRNVTALFNGAGNLETFQASMNLRCHPDVIRMMPIGNKRMIVDIHTISSKILSKISYHTKKQMATTRVSVPEFLHGLTFGHLLCSCTL
jgi:hypothetical protein